VDDFQSMSWCGRGQRTALCALAAPTRAPRWPCLGRPLGRARLQKNKKKPAPIPQAPCGWSSTVDTWFLLYDLNSDEKRDVRFRQLTRPPFSTTGPVTNYRCDPSYRHPDRPQLRTRKLCAPRAVRVQPSYVRQAFKVTQVQVPGWPGVEAWFGATWPGLPRAQGRDQGRHPDPVTRLRRYR